MLVLANDLTRSIVLYNSGEGLVIKHPLSKYLLGSRDPAWIKVKPGKKPLPLPL
jgi:ATP-dependent DNA ligase